MRWCRVSSRFLVRRLLSASAQTTDLTLREGLRRYKGHPKNNVPDGIIAKIGQNLHLQPKHPLGIIKRQIEAYCSQYAASKGQSVFAVHDSHSPLVNPRQNFDDLLVGPAHVSRQPSDTYYLTDDLLLRTHTSAHQNELISGTTGSAAFLCTGDVYRRDEIDSSHYPVFHQMEGVRIFAGGRKCEAEEDLKEILSGLARHLFGDVPMRWRDDYFPFTEPSFELDVYYNGDWMEVLGCGVIHDEVMALAGKSSEECGWAFGLGLERLAMVLFSIPDIRLFWTQDERFHKQFASIDGGDTNAWRKVEFVPYSKFPLCYKDVSFWLPRDNPAFHSNDVYEIIRSLGGDLVERVELFDQFKNAKTGRESHAYRITYRHMDRSLTNEEVDTIQFQVRDELARKLNIDLR